MFEGANVTPETVATAEVQALDATEPRMDVHVTTAEMTLTEDMLAEDVAAPPVIWLDHSEATQAVEAPRERDAEAVIEFLLKKVDEQQVRINEHEGYAELQNQEIDQLRSQLEVMREELDRQLADYEIINQNALAAEHEVEGLKLAVAAAEQQAVALQAEIESLKQKSGVRPMIQLPFSANQKLEKLGFIDGAAIATTGEPLAAQAV